MARKQRKYGLKNDSRPTLVESLLAWHTFNPHALFALLYVSGLSQSDAYRVAFNRFDLSPSAVACAASRMMRDGRVQEHLFRVACDYEYGDLRLIVDFPKADQRLDWAAFEKKRQRNIDADSDCLNPK